MAPTIIPTPGRRIRVLLAILAGQILSGLLAVICVLVVFPWYTNSRHEILVRLVLGISFSQVTLLATWNALGDGRLVLRPISSLLCVIGVCGFAVGSLTWLVPNTPDIWLAGMAMFVQWIVVQVPLWIARLTFGWQIGRIDHENTAGGSRDVQFGIKHLIVWMTLVAIVLGVGKSLLRVESVGWRNSGAFGLVLVCNALFAWPTVFGSLAVRRMPAAMLAAFVFAVAIAFVEPYVFQAMYGGNATSGIFWWINGIQFLWIVGSMLILRRFGFRLVRPRGR